MLVSFSVHPRLSICIWCNLYTKKSLFHIHIWKDKEFTSFVCIYHRWSKEIRPTTCTWSYKWKFLSHNIYNLIWYVTPFHVLQTGLLLQSISKKQKNYKEIHFKWENSFLKKYPLQCVSFTSISKYHHGNNWKRDNQKHLHVWISFLNSQEGNF